MVARKLNCTTKVRLALVLLLGGLGVFALLAAYTVFGARRAEAEFPPLGRFLTAQGLRLHYVDRGTGPPVVLLHGANSSLRDFDASITKQLAKGHRVIAIDRPGYGYSEPSADWMDPARQAKLVRAALVQLGVERPVLVGHSWSGSIVMAYALRYPRELAAGVLLAGAVNSWEGGVHWSIDISGWPLLGQAFAWTVVYPGGRLLLEQSIAQVFSPNTPPADYVARTGAILALRPEAFLASARDVRRLSAFLLEQSKRYDTIQVPVLLLTGDQDSVVPAWNHADRLIKRLPNATRVELANTGHAPHHSRSEEVSRLISHFTRKHYWSSGPSG
ncbi:MAG: pimeloyl-ACP methyl ester carboxylesterase [Gammaproteobacteria bacterium]|jgi:pimeloyl-ACP methyl ester carboxylesterase